MPARPLTGLLGGLLMVQLFTPPSPAIALTAAESSRPTASGSPWATPTPTPTPTLTLGADRPAAQTDETTGRLLVKFRAGTSAAEQSAVVHAVRSVTSARHPGFLEVDPVNAATAITGLRRDRHVAWVEHEVVYPRLADAAQPERDEMGVPAAVQAARARAETFDGVGATIAIIDDGVSPTNPDLAGRVAPGSSACPGSPSTSPSGWHGTAVAALAAAADDGQGITGTAPGATVRSYKVFCDPTGGALSSDIALALQRVATDMSAAVAAGGAPWVVNLSLGDRFQSRAVQEGIDRVHAAGGAIVAAAGNDGGEQPDFPAGGRHTLAVGATELRAGGWRVAAFSTRGSVNVLAPGVDVTTWVEGGGLGKVSGTSFSSPQVAGIVAALLTRGASSEAARTLLTATAAPAQAGAVYPAANGTGRVDALAAYQSWADRVPVAAAFPYAGSVLPTGGHASSVDVLRYDPTPGVAPDGAADLIASSGLATSTDAATATSGADRFGGVIFARQGRVIATTAGPSADGSVVSGFPGDRFLPSPVRVVDQSDSAFGRPAQASQVITAPLSYGSRSQLVTRMVASSKDRITVTARLPGGAQLGGANPAAAVCVWVPSGPGGTALGTEVPDCLDSGSGRVAVDLIAPENGTYLFGILVFDDSANGAYALAAAITSPVTARVVAPVLALPTLRSEGYGYHFTVAPARFPGRVRGLDVQVAHRARVGDRWVTSPWRAAGPRRTTSPDPTSADPTTSPNRATSTVRELLALTRPGGTYLLRARAIDGLGRPGSWSRPVSTDVPLDDRSPGVTWSRNTRVVACPGSAGAGPLACFGGTASGARRGGGQTVTGALTTDTRRFGVIATTCPRCGWLSVYVDGRRTAVVSLRRATTRYRQVVYTSATLSSRTLRHRLRLVGRTTASRDQLQVDAIRLTR